ncbi:putative aminophospholipid-translocase [Friedmanniomyces endolithicus]|uniref:Phospholipid-transporting ATPase n=1 Tax=Friedmanniomyces endolithicus TaxID=329885 RepID=A0AAN6J5S1_9PEZI|nr:putative aminophospholipid-translocase [Friedmanniomyces endolithicus]KAK0286493.1 putative aminophospholipid-translocase [Friedmanniomyces endolithicus]KAK0317208.1 putative aminophospholipid-translocase [Friedmanniomyces endolithicus]KAK1015362.1 putative aminophospholipid-translocase [Friedmanniomyces endolithicus]
MNSANAYHKPPTPDPYADDDDDELDLNELDPVATSRRAPVSHDYGLPLRPLRYGGRRRPREADTEDLGALIDGGDEARRDPGYGEEHEGLLPTANGSARRLSLDPGDSRARRKGISRFLPFTTTTPTSIALPSPTSDSDATTSRIVHVAAPKQTAPHTKYPPNTISNAKYTPWSFLPRTLWNEFKFFFNLYFLLVALSQIVPALRIGYLSTYVAPLAFVVSVTVGKEAVDDLGRRRRDRLANGEGYRVLRLVEGEDEVGGVTGGNKRKVGKTEARKRGKRRRVEGEGGGRVAEAEREEEMVEGLEMPSTRVTEVVKASKDLKVGDVIVLGKDERLPADVVILKSFSTEQITPAAMIETAEVESDTTLVETNDSPSSAPVNETTSDDPSAGGEAFIRTDQLDGETDWKLRLASPLVQNLPASEYGRLRVTAGKPDSKVNEFAGTIELLPKPRIHGQPYDPPIVKPSTRTSSHQAPLDPPSQEPKSSPLNIDNTAWANTVLASPTTVHALILYTGPQTRSALSTSASRSKTGLLEHEINSLTKILCALTATLSLVLVLLETFASPPTTSPTSDASGKGQKWFVAFTRFLILFSTIVPISLRVNLDMGKSVYAFLIQRDTGIPGTVVRTSTIPEDLGRVEFLLTDKTGTLTRNEMVMRRVHVGSVGYGGAEGMEEVGGIVGQVFGGGEGGRGGEGLWTPGQVGFGSGGAGQGTTRTRGEIGARLRDLVVALAVCHNVTPTIEDAEGRQSTAYQASSPDEVAIVQWTEAVGLRLAHRDRKSISLQSTRDGRVVIKVEILHVFPFTSDSKRMGIVVRFLRHIPDDRKRAVEGDDEEGEIVFFQKGADTVMASIVAANDWLDEETGNMAREGLRTLVIGRKALSTTQYVAFSSAYTAAALTLSNRDAGMARVVKQHLETNLDLLGVTGVEDKLQPNVKSSLELLRNAGIKIWMLTGDKVETARCIAISSKLVPRNQPIHTITNLSTPSTALSALEPLHANPANTALLIDGSSLATYLTHHPRAFILTALTLPCLIASRCSPSQKAALATLIRAHSPSSHGARIAAIGDGGNDVSMICAADIGLGIEGKEGRQASLAADFSLTQFSHVTKLLLWHGRNSYTRSAKLALFVMHRGLIISVCQTVFSVASGYEPLALYRDWLLVGYATVYTMFPVFSLVLDRDVDEGVARLYPELYRELRLGRALGYGGFGVWVAVSVWQGVVVQGGSEFLVPGYLRGPSGGSTGNTGEVSAVAFRRMVMVSYTALILNEVLMVCSEITTWHPIMICSVLGTLGLYFGSFPFLGGYFDLAYLLELGFWWRVAAVTAASWGPVVVGKVIRRRVRPPSARKVRGV